MGQWVAGLRDAMGCGGDVATGASLEELCENIPQKLKDEVESTNGETYFDICYRPDAAEEARKPIIKGTIKQKIASGVIVSVSFETEVQEMQGSIGEVAEVILEAARSGNLGKSRIHLFLQ